MKILSVIPRGFTLVEMMAVVAVMAILSLIAIPSYLDRIVRGQIEAALPLADIAKKPIAAAWAGLRDFPADNAAALLPVPDKIVSNHVSSVQVQEGAIHITFGNRANKSIEGKILTLRPAVVEDAPVVPVSWVCGYAEAPANMSVQGVNRTNVTEMYLPLDCRQLNKR